MQKGVIKREVEIVSCVTRKSVLDKSQIGGVKNWYKVLCDFIIKNHAGTTVAMLWLS